MKKYKFGVFKKGEWKAIILLETEEDAKKYAHYYKRYLGELEVREIIYEEEERK